MFQRQPTELLPHLFIGDEQNSCNKEILDKIGITAILNVSSSCQSLFTSQYTYKVIPVQDKNNENILVWFAEAIQFIGKFALKVIYTRKLFYILVTVCKIVNSVVSLLLLLQRQEKNCI